MGLWGNQRSSPCPRLSMIRRQKKSRRAVWAARDHAFQSLDLRLTRRDGDCGKETGDNQAARGVVELELGSLRQAGSGRIMGRGPGVYPSIPIFSQGQPAVAAASRVKLRPGWSALLRGSPGEIRSGVRAAYQHMLAARQTLAILPPSGHAASTSDR